MPIGVSELLARCARIPTSTWSDVIDELDVGGVLSGITWRSGRSRLAGYAKTIQEEVGEFGSYTWDAFDVGTVVATANEGEVLVVAMNGMEVSTFGSLAARGVLARGVAGVVIDGACRDVEEIQATGLRLASRHVTPRSGKQRLQLLTVGGIVTCGGVAIADGDLVIADPTGIVTIPEAFVERALLLAETRERTEQTFLERLRSGELFSVIASSLRHS